VCACWLRINEPLGENSDLVKLEEACLRMLEWECLARWVIVPFYRAKGTIYNA
jgi:hypothetical protein